MNRGRPRHDDILTPREWQVLELIEAGLTNEEIASRLGISFGTAKYHVAEIISKLGVSSRDEAPAAARHARGVVMPLWPFGWTKARGALLLTGTVAVATVLLLSATIFTGILGDSTATSNDGELSDAAADFADGDTESQANVLTRPPAQLSSFYYDLHVDSREARAAPVQENLGARVWHEAPDRWRVERYERTTGQLTNLQVTDGETVWSYSVSEATYSRKPAEAGVRYGPLLGPVASDTLRQYMEDSSDGPAHYWEALQTQEMNGINTLILKQSCCRDETLSQLLSEDRYWVDPTYNFLLRLEETRLPLGGFTLYELVDLQYNPQLNEGLFSFDPPDGVSEVSD